MNESNAAILQTLVEYYRNKCNKLEYDFVLYQAQSQKTISELRSRVNGSSDDKESGNDTREEDESVAKN